jgi:hypothetical protein
MPSRWTAVVAVAMSASVLYGCGGDDSGDPSASPSSATVTPSDTDDAISGDSDLDGEADQGAEMTAEQLCGFLTEETPQVVDLQPAEYAAATFSGDLFSFYSDNGLLTDIDGDDMDALVAEGCPEAATSLLPALGASSFGELLSQ